ncbi:MAG: 1-acyl-sn-glycerol-3-phosphate acyltransferase [Clostridia bacterium]|nr:1-acyl-sn-glycerol-3-phosphate acyltransferase [Clostridia bacterium]
MSENKRKKLTKFEKWFRFLRRIHRFFVVPIFPYKKHGHKERFNDGPYIFVGNHRSVLDIALVAMATDNPIHFIAKKQLYDKRIGKWFAENSQCIPVSRDGTDVRALMQAMKYLKEGSYVGIFPEGKRNKTNEIFLPFKSGAAAISIKTKTPIIPVVIYKKIKAFRFTHAYYGEPFEFTEFYDKKLTQEDIDRADEILRQKMEEQYNILREIIESKKKKQ